MVLSALLHGCGDGTAGATTGSTGQTSTGARSLLPLDRQLQDLVADLTDDSDQSRPGERDMTDRVRAAWERMNTASPDLGRLVLTTLDERPDLDPPMRSRLLESAARSMSRDAAARVELAGALSQRVREFRYPMGERNKASELLGRYCPEQAISVLEPLVIPGRRGVTMPDHDFMLRGYLEAAKAKGKDVETVLCAIAGDPSMTTISRIESFDALKGNASPLVLATLEAAMVESTGDSYMRRMAVRAYVATVDEARAIKKLEAVLVREAEPNMQEFLQSTLAKLRGER